MLLLLLLLLLLLFDVCPDVRDNAIDYKCHGFLNVGPFLARFIQCSWSVMGIGTMTMMKLYQHNHYKTALLIQRKLANVPWINSTVLF